MCSILGSASNAQYISCSKLGNMSKGYRHSEAAPIFDKIIFNKVAFLTASFFHLCFSIFLVSQTTVFPSDLLIPYETITDLGEGGFRRKLASHSIGSSTSLFHC